MKGALPVSSFGAASIVIVPPGRLVPLRLGSSPFESVRHQESRMEVSPPTSVDHPADFVGSFGGGGETMNLRIRNLRHRKLAAMITTGMLVANFTIFPGTALAATIVPVTNDAAGALALATTMVANPATLSGASFAVTPGTGTPDGTSDALGSFPTNGSTFGILTTGDVNLADDPNNSGSDGVDLGSGPVRGNTDYDISILKVDLAVPTGANCLLLDFAFYSEEFPEYVGTQFNDAFIAELDTSTWITAGSTITAPNNFAFDSTNDVVSINSTGTTGMTLANAAGTTYDGATVLLQAATPVSSGAHSLYLSIFDQGDRVLDSAAFIDNIRMITVANVATDCVKGATPVTNTQVSYTGPAAVQYSDPLTLSGHLQTSTGTPIAGENLGFVLGTDSKTAGPTDALGNASAAPYNELQQPGSATTVNVSFAGDAAAIPPLVNSTSTAPFTINKEDCTVTYTGDVLVNAVNPTNLSAQFGELDLTPGDWLNKLITFTVTDASLVVTTYTATTNSAGVAAMTASLGPNVYAVAVSFAGDDFYKPCVSTADTLVTVQAANAKITGGGWISQGTGNTNFGFNVIQDVTGLKGQLQVRIRSGKDRFHSTSVLTLNSTGNSGTWTGTGRWDGVTGYTFTVSVVDNGTGGKKGGDTISIEIKSPTSLTVFTTGGPVPLKGGNIVVH
jgi:hypothetical protein